MCCCFLKQSKEYLMLLVSSSIVEEVLGSFLLGVWTKLVVDCLIFSCNKAADCTFFKGFSLGTWAGTCCCKPSIKLALAKLILLFSTNYLR